MTTDLDEIEVLWSRLEAAKSRRRTKQPVSARRSPRTDPQVGDLFPFDPKSQPDVTVRIVALSRSEVTGRWRSKGEVYTVKWARYWWTEGKNKPEKRTPADVLVDPWPGDVSPWGVVAWVGENSISLDSGRRVIRDDWRAADPSGFRPG